MYMSVYNLECIDKCTCTGCGSQYVQKHPHSNSFLIYVLTFDTSPFSLT